MPNIKSAIKRVNTIKSKTEQNVMIKTAYKTALEAGDKNLATEKYKVATKAINKAANKGVIKANTASRKNSSLTKALNAVK